LKFSNRNPQNLKYFLIKKSFYKTTKMMK